MADSQQRFLDQDESSTGTWISIGHPAVAEICSQGYDFVVIDLEHTAMSLETLENMLRAVDRDVAPIVRVPTNDPVWIKRVLDLGVAGLMIPRVETREQAEQAVEAMQYPPNGDRGVAPARASDYGRTFGEYYKHADDELTTILQIETELGASNAAEIVSVDGVDAVIVGHGDLSASLDVFGQWESETFESTLNSIVTTVHDAGKQVGMLATDEESIERWTGAGIDFLIAGADIAYLAEGSDLAREKHETLTEE
ncbi:aldolase [Haloarcula sp. CBA1130]|uniref:HpcH/HpaI aldolase family protein n=1 Tax=unclassified Haloarcula TaxID=2624677 RepID=UPI001248C1BF|nr:MULTISPECIES: aldolase/citrate lyase family protein [unclassified Haloarcula]KAA9396331.1 aldolase [Haloarcula sp. CBA1130]KAA9398316.1 aldolase [Haloarcula sp. CBA1129]